MIGENIRRLRTEHHMTQKELADRLFVTAQAVSRWENGDVEPSLKTITEMAKIFEVPSDEILGIEPIHQYNNETVEEESTVYSNSYNTSHNSHASFGPQMLAVCERCNRPIFNADEIVRIRKSNRSEVRCRECQEHIERNLQKKMALEREEYESKCIKKARRARVKCIILGIVLIAWFFLSFFTSLAEVNSQNIGDFFLGSISLLVIFYIILSFVGCFFLRNSFFGEMILNITFFLSDFLNDLFDFDDFIFWVIFGVFFLIALAIGAVIALIVGCVVAPVLFPFALRKNIKHPEKTNLGSFRDK